MDLNSVNLVGRLVDNPAFTKGTKETQTDDRCWFRLAVNNPGDQETTFIPVICWGKRARAVSQYCSKGKEVAVVGSLKSRSTQREDGTWQNYVEVSASNVSFGADAKNKGQPAAAGTAPGHQAAPSMSGISDDMIKAIAQMVVGKLANEQAAQAAPPTEDTDDNPFAV